MKLLLTLVLAVLVLALSAAEELETTEEDIFPADSCGFGRRMCTRVMKCVSLVSVCDGKDDCGDGSDEENCSLVGKKSVLSRTFACPPVNCFVDPCLTANCGVLSCVRGCYCTATCQ